MNMNLNMYHQPNGKLRSQQAGATLFTSLVFLILMTLVTVSATKISMLDILMAGNNQQKMEAYQETSKDLKDVTSVIQLYKPLITNGQITAWTHQVTSTDKNKSQTINNRVKKYQCGGFDGQAVSIGPDVPPCYLFDFRADTKKANSNAHDRHNRGGGKEFPNPSKNSYL